jgi:hypothetical protein
VIILFIIYGVCDLNIAKPIILLCHGESYEKIIPRSNSRRSQTIVFQSNISQEMVDLIQKIAKILPQNKNVR